MASSEEDDSTVQNLELACTNLRSLLLTTTKVEENLEKIETQFGKTEEALASAAKELAPLQSMAITTKSLETRIKRAVNPALSLLDEFKLCESLQQKLIQLSSGLNMKNPEKRLHHLLRYVVCVDQLNDTILVMSRDGGPVIQKLQEVVEFLSRTKAADQDRTCRLKETLVTLRALYETEVNTMRFDGLLDEALVDLQDEFERILQKLRHQNVGESSCENKLEAEYNELMLVDSDLGSDLEVEVLRRIAETLAANDCLDICIEIFVKVRYRKAAKALMRLNPDYLRTYTPEEIDDMEWATLETAVTLWIQHFQLAVKTVFVSEKKLCLQVLGKIMDGVIWPECFVKIADKIMAVFFRFGEGVARSSKEPQKLFKLLDMFESLENIKVQFSEIFDGESGADICMRFRELQKLIVHASSKVFWEFGLQIEGNSDGLPPPEDGSVPKIVRYAVNYLKYLATESYSAAMAKVLRTEQIWKAGVLSKPETDENLVNDAVSGVMEALRRNIETKKSYYRDNILAHLFTMNTYWYIYMRTRNTELGELLGEDNMKTKYKVVAEESAYLYQKQAWGPLVRILQEGEDSKRQKNREAAGVWARGKYEAFLKGIDEILQWHSETCSIPDPDLRLQIRKATVKLVVPIYIELLDTYADVLPARSIVSAESIEGVIGQMFDGGDGKVKVRGKKDRTVGGASVLESEVEGFGRSRSSSMDI